MPERIYNETGDEKELKPSQKHLLVASYFMNSPFAPILKPFEKLDTVRVTHINGITLQGESFPTFLGLNKDEIVKASHIPNALFIGSRIRNIGFRIGMWSKIRPDLANPQCPATVVMEPWSQFYDIDHDILQSDLDVFVPVKKISKGLISTMLKRAEIDHLGIEKSRTEENGFKAKWMASTGTTVEFLFFEKQSDLHPSVEWSVYHASSIPNTISAIPQNDGSIVFLDLCDAEKTDPSLATVPYLEQKAKRGSVRRTNTFLRVIGDYGTGCVPFSDVEALSRTQGCPTIKQEESIAKNILKLKARSFADNNLVQKGLSLAPSLDTIRL